MNELIEKVKEWHHERNLINGSSDQAQFVKLGEEMGELAGNICKGRDITDDIGDIIVVLINMAERNGLTLESCLEHAYGDIKHRTGMMVDGVFVKEQEL